MNIKNLLMSVICFMGISAFGQTSTSSDSISVNTKIEDHPRLLLFKGEEKELLKNINNDPYWRDINQSIISEADKMLLLPENERKLIGPRLLDVSRENLRRIFYLSYAFRMTGFDKYEERAELEMLKAATFTDWNPKHFLDVGEMTLAMAIGYDWNFSKLSASSKKIIKEAIIEKGIKPSLNYNANTQWLDGNNNWNQVCNAGISMGVLAVYEENPKLSTLLLNRSIRSLPNSMNEYGPDGGFPEGIGYWGYGTSFNCILLDALDKIYKSDFGLSKIPGFMKTGIFSQVMITPSLNTFCHSDVGIRATFEPAVFWFYSKTKDQSLLCYQKKIINNDNSKRYLRDRLLPLAILWGASSKASMSVSKEPSELMWITQSRVPISIMRTSWTDPNAIYLAYKGGSPSSNHAHMDAGSFLLEANGVRWGLDLGMQSYDAVEKAGIDLWNKGQNSTRWDVYRLNNFVHNTLTFNGEKQMVDGSATIDTFSKNKDFMCLTSNLSSIYTNTLKQVLRGVALVNKSYVVVEDKITTDTKPVKMRWNMTTQATEVTKISENILLLKFKNKKLFMKVDGITDLVPYFKPAKPLTDFESPNPGISLMGFEVMLPAKNTQTIRVFLMPEDEKNVDDCKYLLK